MQFIVYLCVHIYVQDSSRSESHSWSELGCVLAATTCMGLTA